MLRCCCFWPSDYALSPSLGVAPSFPLAPRFHSASSRGDYRASISNKRSPSAGEGRGAIQFAPDAMLAALGQPKSAANLPPSLVPLRRRCSTYTRNSSENERSRVSSSLSQGVILKVINKREPYNSFPAEASQRLAGRPKCCGVSPIFFTFSLVRTYILHVRLLFVASQFFFAAPH